MDGYGIGRVAMRKEPNELIISEGEKQIILSADKIKLVSWHTAEDGKIIPEFDESQIEISYREDDEEGWGAGSDEYFSTADIKAMADCIRSVINKKDLSAEYICQNDLFRIHIGYDPLNDTYSFTAALIETLTREYHITITKTGLTLSELDEYIQPFFEWERKFSIPYHKEGSNV